MEHRPTKKVLIEATKCLSGDNDGIQRYSVELLRGLAPIASDRDSGWEIDVYFGMWFMFDLREIHEYTVAETPKANPPAKLRALLWNMRIGKTMERWLRTRFPERVTGAIESAKRAFDKVFWGRFKPLNLDKYDLVHLSLPQAYGFIARSRTSALLTTVHDLTHLHFPQFHVEGNISQAQKGFDFCVARDSSFIAVSESTRSDLLETYDHLDPEDVSTVYEACDRRLFHEVDDAGVRAEVRGKYGIPDQRYLLTLSTLEPRKNLLNTIRAFLLLLEEVPATDIVLVIAGKKGWKFEELFAQGGPGFERVFFTGFVADEDLAALYSGATALSYVSHYEGFGLPALEAMSCGTPVVYGNKGSLPEVVGDAGLPADPNNVEDIKDNFRLITEDQELRARLGRKALARAQRFSWKRTATETLEVYRKVIATSRMRADQQVG